MTPRDAVALLRREATQLPPGAGEAVLVLIDHVLRLEQYAQLVRNAVESAEGDRPENAVLGGG